MAAVNCSSSRELSCREATSFSASCKSRERGKSELPEEAGLKGRPGTLSDRSGTHEAKCSASLEGRPPEHAQAPPNLLQVL